MDNRNVIIGLWIIEMCNRNGMTGIVMDNRNMNNRNEIMVIGVDNRNG